MSKEKEKEKEVNPFAGMTVSQIQEALKNISSVLETTTDISLADRKSLVASTSKTTETILKPLASAKSASKEMIKRLRKPTASVRDTVFLVFQNSLKTALETLETSLQNLKEGQEEFGYKPLGYVFDYLTDTSDSKKAFQLEPVRIKSQDAGKKELTLVIYPTFALSKYVKKG